MDFINSRTEQNLRDAFAGESQARNRYEFYADQAKKEGLLDIANIFNRVSGNEKEHAEVWLKHLGGIKDTAQNLQSAISGEDYEHNKMYPEFARIAREEGFENIARHFELVAQIENNHSNEFKKALEEVRTNTVYSRPESVQWRCQACGHRHVGTEPPNVCPFCGHSKDYFEVLPCECPAK